MSVGAGMRLAELLAAVSLATDLGRGFPPEKALRTCVLADRLGAALGLDLRTRRDMYHAALIHPVGCVAFTHEQVRTFGTSELTALPAVARADDTRPGEALRALRDSLQGEPVARRLRAVVKGVTAGKAFAEYAVRADCEAGARFTARVGQPDEVARIVVQVHERWDGKGWPARLRGEDVELGARVIAVADQADIFDRAGGVEEAVAMVRRRAGGWFDPAVAEAFRRRAGEILEPVPGGSVWEAALDAEPAPRATIGERRLDEVAAALADLVDLKSPYMLGHSGGVGRLGEAAATRLGLQADACADVRRAGLLQDLGRLGVSNLVWDRRGALTRSEWEQVRLHPYHTERILARSPVLAPLAQAAGMHHERPDGSGYHRGVTAAAIPVAARILAAADVFQALTEPRPHRPAVSAEAAAAELGRMAGAGVLDPEAARAVREAAGMPPGRRGGPAGWPADLTDREVEVLRLLARGRSKKEVAAALVIAPGTVHTHTVHIYAKLGVSTRAGVALFAMEHGLVER